MTNTLIPLKYSYSFTRHKGGVMSIEMPNTVIVGGSALANIPDAQTLEIIEDTSTPFGEISSAIKIMRLAGHTFAFLNRHGEGHTLYPHQIPEQANFFKFMELELTNVIQFTAVGSVKVAPPGTFVVFDEVFNRTHSRPNALLNNVVAHLSHNHPFCPDLKQKAIEAIKESGAQYNEVNACACIQGPEFGNIIDNLLYRKLGIAAVGMTQYPASILGRWASRCQIMIGLFTDTDCAEEDEQVSAEKVEANAAKHLQTQIEILKRLLSKTSGKTHCDHCVQAPSIIVTDRSKWPKEEQAIIELMFKRFREQRK